MQIKNELRKELLKRRQNIQNRNDKDKQIISFVSSLNEYKYADKLLTYVPLNGEINTEPLIINALSDGKIVAVPYCEDKHGNMSFYIINSLSELKVGTFGVSEPDINLNKRLEDFEKSIIIVPGVSFNRDGHRLGYGGGYYDRFLENFGGTSIGLCYDEMICNTIPLEEHDIAVNFLITDKSIENLGG